MAVITYNQAKQALAMGEIPAFLVLHGEDRYQAREMIRYLRSRLEARNSSGIDYLEWDEEAVEADIYKSLVTLPLGTAERMAVINNPDVSAVKSYLKVNNPRLVAVLLMEKKLKKKDLKDIENGWVVECIPLKGRELVRWLQEEAISRGNELPTAAAEYLRFSCGENPALLSQEIEKASLYLGKKQRRITVDVFQSVGSRTAGRTLFELVDAVAERKGSAAVEVLQELLAQGKPPVLLVSMLSRHYLQMLEAYWLLEEGVSPGELSGVMGAHPFVAKKLMKQIRSYHLSEIEKILDGLLELDLSLKKGKGSPELLMTSFLGTV
jgi:DNA polymerase-3 subunit delta